MYHVDFLNKNTFRQYPLQGISVTTEEGKLLPTSLFTAARFMVSAPYKELFINRVFISGGHINILVAVMDGSTLVYAGAFDAEVTKDYQAIQLSPLLPSASGVIHLGPKGVLEELQGIHTFDYANGRIEDSLVTRLVRPPVRSINVHGKRLVGNIKLQYSNIRELLPRDKGSPLKLEVIARDTVAAKNDTGSLFGNCPTTPIGTMNGVSPDEAGNIDIFGISPVTVAVDPGSHKLVVSVAGISKDELCAIETRIPPLNNTSIYLADITTATLPEWKTWPQYK